MNEGLKIRIEGFIQYLSKDEPFNGDEVREISCYFVTKLCKHNAEENQIKYILNDERMNEL